MLEVYTPPNLPNKPLNIQKIQITCSCIKHTFKKNKEILTTIKCALGHLQRSEAPTPQDPLRKTNAIKSLGTSLAWWARNLLESIGIAQA